MGLSGIGSPSDHQPVRATGRHRGHMVAEKKAYRSAPPRDWKVRDGELEDLRAAAFPDAAQIPGAVTLTFRQAMYRAAKLQSMSTRSGAYGRQGSGLPSASARCGRNVAVRR